MMCYPTSGYILLSLTKLKFYGGRGSDVGAGGWGPDNPYTPPQITFGNSGQKCMQKKINVSFCLRFHDLFDFPQIFCPTSFVKIFFACNSSRSPSNTLLITLKPFQECNIHIKQINCEKVSNLTVF